KAPEVYSTPLMKICVFIDGQNFYRSLLRFDEALRVDYDKLARWITQAVGGSPATFAGAYYYVGVSADAPARVGGFLKGLEPRPVLRRGSPVGWDRRLPSRARARGRPRTLARTRAYRRPRWWFHVAPAGPSEHRSGARARPGGAAACGSAPAPREPRLLRHAMAVTSTSAGRPGARGARAADDRGRRVRRVRGDRRRRPFGPRHPESRRHDQPGRRVGRRLTPPDRTARQGMIAAMTLAERLAVFAADLDVTHASAVVLPAALSTGEAERVTGRAVLAAAVAGYEAITRIGLAVPGAFHARGWHATSTCGVFAAALAVGKVMGLDAKRLASAVGLAGSFASGVMEYLTDGSWSKRVHAGWAGHGGAIAATLARGGFGGPATILEGRFGLYATMLGRAPDLAPFETLGREWETLAVGYKPFPCCHLLHAYLDCALALGGEHRLAPEAIAEVECRVPAGEVPIIGEPRHAKLEPRTSYAAQFSLPYTVAAALVDGRVRLDTFPRERLGDPRLLGL